MPDMPRSHLLAYALAAIVVVVFGVRHVTASRAQDAAGAAPGPIALDRGDEGHDRGRVTVHVAGRVRRPGVYRLPAGARVDDAVRQAGGARPRADLTQVNLAQELEDGRQIVVPARLVPGSPAAAAAASGTVPTGPINLNTATLEQLDTLDGIGPATAQSILDFREEHGGFTNVEELDQVPGIGPATMTALRDKVTA